MWEFRHNPWIVQLIGVVHDPGTDARILYRVMELATDDLEGYFGYLYKRLRISDASLKSLCVSLLKGLHALHSRKPFAAYHRDVKPANILVCPASAFTASASATDTHVFKLGDVGEARIGGPGMLTLSIGTPFYMAQEIATGEYDGRVDVFSFGVTLAEVVVKFLAPPSVLASITPAERSQRGEWVAAAATFAQDSGRAVLAELINGCAKESVDSRLTSDAALAMALRLPPDVRTCVSCGCGGDV